MVNPNARLTGSAAAIFLRSHVTEPRVDRTATYGSYYRNDIAINRTSTGGRGRGGGGRQWRK